MINLFRDIRNRFLNESKFGKYLTFILGEIILIVIGILIALSIDNWNESVKEHKKAELLIVRIHKQIGQNLLQSQQNILQLENRIEGMIVLMSMIGPQSVNQNEKLLDSLITTSLKDYDIGLDLNTLIEAQANGEIALIKNDSIRIALYKLSAMVSHIGRRENIANSDLNNFLVPYLYKNANCRNISTVVDDDYKKLVGYSKLDPTNYSKILSDREFENLIDNRIFYALSTIDLYRDLKTHLENIIELSEEK